MKKLLGWRGLLMCAALAFAMGSSDGGDGGCSSTGACGTKHVIFTGMRNETDDGKCDLTSGHTGSHHCDVCGEYF